MAWPLYSPQVKGANLIRKGTDSTVDPAIIFHKRQSDTILPSRYGVTWNTIKDTRLVAIPTDDGIAERLKLAEQTIASLEGEIADCIAVNTELKTVLAKIRELAG